MICSFSKRQSHFQIEAFQESIKFKNVLNFKNCLSNVHNSPLSFALTVPSANEISCDISYLEGNNVTLKRRLSPDRLCVNVSMG